jgi:hypothetical protein
MPTHAKLESVLPKYAADKLISLGDFGNRIQKLGGIDSPL